MTPEKSLPLQQDSKRFQKTPINVGLIGMGTVGTGVVQYFLDGGNEPFNVHLKRVAVRNLDKAREVDIPYVTNNVEDVLKDPDIQVIVELVGGESPAKEMLLEAIDHKKSIVTANKVVVARNAKELFDAAQARSVDVGFEASVAGGIPIIAVLNGLKGQEITKIMGILNGTTNYILSRMEEGLSFRAALRRAQEQGFAEKNHILDTGGFDARDKLAILSSIICNTPINPDSIYCEGITDITPVDIDFARKYRIEEGEPGYTVKLLASAIRYNNDLELHVYPALLRKDHPLAAVRDEFNAIYVEGELSGPQMYLGRGAGRKATTSAVVSDIFRVANNIRKGVTDDLPTLTNNTNLINVNDIERNGYVRLNLLHKPGSGAEVFKILADHGFNIVDSLQRGSYRAQVEGKTFIPDIITTEKLPYGKVEPALKEVRGSLRVAGKPVYLRFEE